VGERNLAPGQGILALDGNPWGGVENPGWGIEN